MCLNNVLLILSSLFFLLIALEDVFDKIVYKNIKSLRTHFRQLKNDFGI